MGYFLKQYNKKTGSGDEDHFMTLTGNGARTTRIKVSKELGTMNNPGYQFEDEAITGITFGPQGDDTATTYYFHGKIKRMSTDQIFDVKLYNQNEGQLYKEQYIKTICVAKGVEYENVVQPEWTDIEFIFTPTIPFDSLVFILQRTVEIDYKTEVRYPIIAFQELSIVNNFLIGDNSLITDINAKVIKIGVQSRPGLLMCINREEIRTSRTGIYELKNGVMSPSFFSVCRAAEENYEQQTEISELNKLNNWIIDVNNKITEIDTKFRDGKEPYKTHAQVEAAKKLIPSKCFFANAKTRKIDSFTLDYLYKTNQDNG